MNRDQRPAPSRIATNRGTHIATTGEIVDGVKEYTLESWHEFLDLVTKVFLPAPAYVFRGQADYAWPIESTLDRLQKKHPHRINLGGGVPKEFTTPPLSDEDHLAAFKRAIRGRRGSNPGPLTDEQLWALGQHHGLATPLLDWTRSPFAALFFAFEDERRVDQADCFTKPDFRGVYALSTSTIDEKPRSRRRGSTKGHEAKLVSSAGDENYRLVSQGGLLLRMPRSIDLEKYARKKFKGDNRRATLIKIGIPNKDRRGCLVTLNKMNINRLSLFPDIDGAAQYVNSLWQPGHEDSIAYV